MEEQNLRLRELLKEALAILPTEEEMDETACVYAISCSYCGAQVWHDKSHGYARGSHDEEHKESCLVVRAQKELGIQ